MNVTAMSVIDDDASMLGSMAMQPTMTASTAIQLMSAMIDKRIATARQYPRRISKFKSEAAGLLKEDVETARSAEYAKPVGSGKVRGASIRLAELAAMCWGNLDIEFGEPIVNDKSVTMTATAYDLERNYRVQGIATASIINAKGQRFPQHMIETTILACSSKARRNAILNIIPKAYITDLLQIAKEVAEGNKEPLEVVRVKMLDFFARTYKVTDQQVFEMLGVGGVDDIGEPQIDELRMAANALKDGEAKPEDFFPALTTNKADAVKAKIADRQKAKQPATDKPTTDKPANGQMFHDPVDTAAITK